MQEVIIKNLPTKYAIIAEPDEDFGYNNGNINELKKWLTKNPLGGLHIHLNELEVNGQLLSVKEGVDVMGLKNILSSSIDGSRIELSESVYNLSLVSYEGRCDAACLPYFTVKYPPSHFSAKNWGDPLPAEWELDFIHEINTLNNLLNSVLNDNLSLNNEKTLQNAKTSLETIKIPYSSIWHELDEGKYHGILECNKRNLDQTKFKGSTTRNSKHPIEAMLFNSWREFFLYELSMLMTESLYCQACGKRIQKAIEHKNGRPTEYCNDKGCVRARNALAKRKSRMKLS